MCTMATTIQVAITDYLKTTYRPDRECIDGAMRERRVRKWEHARLQALLVMWFGRHEEEWSVQIATEWRTRVSPTRIRVPDLVAVLREPQPDVLTLPPLLVVEILSPDDSYADLQDRCQDYRVMGVPTVWIIDPTTRSARMCSGDNWMETRRLTAPNPQAPGIEMYVNLDELFAGLKI
jgi:Uma2 family endonuclease